jgi:hypothetical protein
MATTVSGHVRPSPELERQKTSPKEVRSQNVRPIRPLDLWVDIEGEGGTG